MRAARLMEIAPAESPRLLADVQEPQELGSNARRPALERLEDALGREFADRLVAALSKEALDRLEAALSPEFAERLAAVLATERHEEH